MVVLKPYAQALFEVAHEADMEEVFLANLMELSKVWENEDTFVKALRHPQITKKEKQQWIQEIFAKKLDPLFVRSLCVLCQHNVIDKLIEIAKLYKECYWQAHDMEVIKVQSAVALDEEQLQQLKSMLEKKLNKKVELDVEIRPELIAGLRVQAKDRILDNSVLSRIEAMRERIRD